ncbi:TPA: alcohol dehydrogenase [Candidatus Marinimicrobia bacterium]|nr:MAG: Iron-containing alcohol dehydrogenase [Marinimicrobia bacterium 46_43]HAE86556.1 alcohol dehydrogenase [Candidatus Neomarinimicrobiota bacterium]HBY18646.1 alcohol dehydrogenase [Candidatus Neomarinimicrobiota bacterium]
MIMSSFMPVRLFWGRNCLTESTYPLNQLGRKALIVTGRHSADKSGALNDVQTVLKNSGVSYVHFNQVTENPLVKTVQEAADLCMEEYCDFIIGIGGGSPIDAAKAVAVAVFNKMKAGDVYDVRRIQGALPLVAVPLTSGTGTEATPFSVLTDERNGKKAGFGHDSMFPRVSYCDPAYTRTVPPIVTRDTGLDALSHLLEGVFSAKRNVTLYPLIRQGVLDIMQWLEYAMEDGNDLEARSRLMMASLWGGMVIAQTGTTLQHAIGYPLTVRYGVSHGRANGLVLSAIYRLYYPAVKNALHQVFGADASSLGDRLDNWLASFALTESLTIPRENIPDMAREVMGARNMANNPLSVNPSDIEGLYHTLC